MTDIMAELRRKTANRDGDDGVIGVTFGEMRSLLDALDALSWYADEDNYHDPTDVPDHLYRDSGDVLLIRGGGGQRARTALAALERSDDQ